MLFISRNCKQTKTKLENVQVVPRPIHDFFNGALVSAVSLIYIMYWKMNKAIRRNSACIQTAFSEYREGVTGKSRAPFERALNSNLETIWDIGINTNRLTLQPTAYSSTLLQYSTATA
jgi:hypothetical protein